MSEEKFFFYLNGVQYNHPCSYSDLKNNGWEICYGNYSESSIIDEHVVVKMSNSRNYITAEIYNTTGDPKELRDCTVGGIRVEQTFYSNGFEAPSGIKIGSSRDEVINAYGFPKSTETYDDYILYSYAISRGFGYINFCFSKQTNECYLIEFRNTIF